MSDIYATYQIGDYVRFGDTSSSSSSIKICLGFAQADCNMFVINPNGNDGAVDLSFSHNQQ